MRQVQNTSIEGYSHSPLLKFLQMICNPAFCIALLKCLLHRLQTLRRFFTCYEDLHQIIRDWTTNRVPITGNNTPYREFFYSVDAHVERFGAVTGLWGLLSEKLMAWQCQDLSSHSVQSAHRELHLCSSTLYSVVNCLKGWNNFQCNVMVIWHQPSHSQTLWPQG